MTIYDGGRLPETIEMHGRGTPVERWVFDGADPELRCVWPTASLAYRLEVEAIDRVDRATAGILGCYRALLTHPAGTEAMVRRLRALRRAEKIVQPEVRT